MNEVLPDREGKTHNSRLFRADTCNTLLICPREQRSAPLRTVVHVDRLAADEAMRADLRHYAFGRAAGNVELLVRCMLPDLGLGIGLEVLAEHRLDLWLQLQVPLRASRQLPEGESAWRHAIGTGVDEQR